MTARFRTMGNNCPCATSSSSGPRSSSGLGPCCPGATFPTNLYAHLIFDGVSYDIPLLFGGVPGVLAYTGLDGNPANTLFECTNVDPDDPCRPGSQPAVIFSSYQMVISGRGFSLVSTSGALSCGPGHWMLSGSLSCTALDVCSQVGADYLCGDKPTPFGTPFDLDGSVEITE